MPLFWSYLPIIAIIGPYESYSPHIWQKKIIIGNIYRPNTYPNSDLDICMHTMNELQNILAGEHKDTFIIGDMNIDLLKFPNHNKTGEYMENIFTQGFLPLITIPRRMTDHSATLIDHTCIYSNKPDITATSNIIITDVSDHFGIFSSIKYTNYKYAHHPTGKISRSFSQAKMFSQVTLLQHSDFSPVLNTNCPNEGYNILADIYKNAFNFKIDKKHFKRSPWMSKGLL